jgi:alpha-L-arabinofuranosidase
VQIKQAVGQARNLADSGHLHLGITMLDEIWLSCNDKPSSAGIRKQVLHLLKAMATFAFRAKDLR